MILAAVVHVTDLRFATVTTPVRAIFLGVTDILPLDEGAKAY